MRLLFRAATLLAVSLPGARAWARDVPCQPVDPGVITVDGLLGDWQGAEAMTLAGDGLTLELRCNFTSDDLYLAATVHAAQPEAGSAELDFAASENGPVTSLTITPRTKSARWGGASPPRDPQRARAVVAGVPAGDGYAIEVGLPLADVPGFTATAPAIPFALRVDSAGATLATSPRPPRGPLDRIELASGAQALDSFLAEVHSSRADLRWDHLAHVAEDPGLQRIVLAGVHLGVVTSRDFTFVDLPAAAGDDVTGIDLEDLSGDGRDWLIVRYTERGGGGARDVLAAYRPSGDQFVRPFAHEVEKRVGDRILMDRWEYRPAPGGGRELVLSAEPAVGFSRESYQEAPATDLTPILLPWSDVKIERWRFQGDGAALAE